MTTAAESEPESMLPVSAPRRCRVLVVGDHDATEMTVCGVCGRVRGGWTYADEERQTGTVTQRCRCDRRDEPRWPGFDFNTAVELCWCCAAEAIRSGSKWSTVLCAECKERAIALMRREGRFVVPIGRHSLMNQVGVSAAELRDGTTSPTEAAARLLGFGARMTVIWEWGARQALVNLEAIGADGESPVLLRDYLDGVAAIPVDKRSVFEVLRREMVQK